MKIERIYIGCYRHDLQFTRTCVASIRTFYPEIPIFLIKDLFYGDFSTAEIERYFGVRQFQTGPKIFNWGFGKLEALFDPEPRRFLYLDADTVLAGPLLETLEACGEDFILQQEFPTPEFVRSHYFDLDALRALDPSFVFCGESSNTGQWVGRSGLLRREEFESLVEWTSPPRLKHPDVFKMGEQGLLNYFLSREAAAGRLSLRRLPLMEVGNNVNHLDCAKLGPGSPYPFIIHWCGLRKPEFSAMPRGDILEHFNRIYYARLPLGSLRRPLRKLASRVSIKGRAVAKRLLGRR